MQPLTRLKRKQVVLASIVAVVFLGMVVLSIVMSVMHVRSASSFAHGWGTNRRIGATPEPAERQIQQGALGAYPMFTPSGNNSNTAQWIDTAQAMGARAALINNPAGAAVIQNFASFARAAGLKFGVSLSYNSNGTEIYNDVFNARLVEIISNFNDIFEIRIEGDIEHDVFTRFLQTVRYHSPYVVVTADTLQADVLLLTQPPSGAVFNVHGSLYRPHQLVQNMPGSATALTSLYLNTVGRNMTLLLNVPVNAAGIIEKVYVNRLEQLAINVAEKFENPLDFEVRTGGRNIADIEFTTINFEETDLSLARHEFIIDVRLARTQRVNFLIIEESPANSQRIESIRIYAHNNGNFVRLESRAFVGQKAIFDFPFLLTPITDNIRIVVLQSRDTPIIGNIAVF